MRQTGEQKYFTSMEYTHSADSLFHFMKSQDYLANALEKKRLVPRYCDENIDYLDLNIANHHIMLLEKCFCDIPMHKLTEPFRVEFAENNDAINNCSDTIQNQKTHPDFYGEFAIAFSKDWCIKNNLQPVHYVNPKSGYIEDYRRVFNWAMSQEEIPNNLFDEILSKLAESTRENAIDQTATSAIQETAGNHSAEETAPGIPLVSDDPLNPEAFVATGIDVSF